MRRVKRFNSAIFSIHGVDGYTRVHLAGSSGEKVQNHKELMGQVGVSLLKTQPIVFLIALIIQFTLAQLEMQNMGGPTRLIGLLVFCCAVAQSGGNRIGISKRSLLPALTPPDTPAHLPPDWCGKLIQLISCR